MKKIIYLLISFVVFELFLRIINYGHSNVYFYQNDEYSGYRLKSNIKNGLYVELKDKNI